MSAANPCGHPRATISKSLRLDQVKIAFHAPRGPFLDPAGGGGDRVMTRNLIDALTARGHRVEVVSHLDARDLYLGRLPLRRLLIESLSIRRRMRAFAPDAWLVYSPCVTYPDLFGWWLQPGRYVLYGAHEGRRARLPRRWRWLYVYAHRRTLGRADAITIDRPAIAARLDRAADAAKVQVLPPAPRPWKQIPSREQSRLRLGIDPDVPVALCLARFSEAKLGKTDMVLTLLRTLAELPRDIVLVLVGDDGPGRPRVEDEIVRLGLERAVHFIGPTERELIFEEISNDDVPWFYAAADVYAYPHPRDQVWLSLIEAQACARPIVTMRTESSELVIRHDETGLLAADEAEFRSCLGALLSDRERCETMGRAAYEDFVARHSMEIQMDRLEALLTERS
jgi:glycosyltransferase involved in cell wall biosynthesis